MALFEALGDGRMSRRRSTNPTKAISITLPEALLVRLDKLLAYTASRSAYIAAALEAKLDKHEAFDLSEIPLSRLRYEVYKRPETSAALKLALNAEEVNSSSSNPDANL